MVNFEKQYFDGPEDKQLKQKIECLLSDLRLVGPEKPLGYLPLDILDKYKIDSEELKEELRQKGLKILILSREESNICDNGAFYAYDEAPLKKLLDNNRPILEKHGWPTEPESFVRHLKVSIKDKGDLRELIADAFGDKPDHGGRKLPSN